jgi:endonuclease-3
MVNTITPALFRRYKTAKEFADADTSELETMIHSSGFFRNKAKSIKAACHLIAEKHGGKVPETMEELLELPGVARKTANVVLGVAFGKAEGVVVDTHVQRLSRRLDLSKESRPEKIEEDLMRIVPHEKWIAFAHLLSITDERNAPRCGQSAPNVPSRISVIPTRRRFSSVCDPCSESFSGRWRSARLWPPSHCSRGSLLCS